MHCLSPNRPGDTLTSSLLVDAPSFIKHHYPGTVDLVVVVVVVVVEVLLYVHRNRRLIRDGSPGRPPGLPRSY